MPNGILVQCQLSSQRSSGAILSLFGLLLFKKEEKEEKKKQLFEGLVQYQLKQEGAVEQFR